MNKKWFDIRAAADGKQVEIYVYDEIGAFGIRADRFIEALKSKGDLDAIALHINSPGGDPFAAAAMYLALKRHPATVTAYNDGLVASAASVVLMAGDRIIAPENTMLMIHDPVGGVFGTADEMRDFAGAMDKIAQTILTAYRRTGKTDEELAEIMSAETWYTAAEALEAGFIDEISDEIQVAAFFDLQRFANPPAAAIQAQPAPDPDPAPPVKLSKAEHSIVAQAAKIIDKREQAAHRREALSEASAIVKACADAGHPELAAGFLADGLDLAAVKAALAKPENIATAAAGYAAAQVSEIVALCANAGVPDMAEGFIERGATLEAVRDRLQHAGNIRARCGAARMLHRAADYIRAGATPDEVGANLLALKIAMENGPEIDGHLGPDIDAHGQPRARARSRPSTAAEIYAARNHRRPALDADRLAAAIQKALK